MSNELMEVLDHLNTAYEILEDFPMNDPDTGQWMDEIDAMYAAIETRIKSGEEE